MLRTRSAWALTGAVTTPQRLKRTASVRGAQPRRDEPQVWSVPVTDPAAPLRLRAQDTRPQKRHAQRCSRRRTAPASRRLRSARGFARSRILAVEAGLRASPSRRPLQPARRALHHCELVARQQRQHHSPVRQPSRRVPRRQCRQARRGHRRPMSTRRRRCSHQHARSRRRHRRRRLLVEPAPRQAALAEQSRCGRRGRLQFRGQERRGLNGARRPEEHGHRHLRSHSEPVPAAHDPQRRARAVRHPMLQHARPARHSRARVPGPLPARPDSWREQVPYPIERHHLGQVRRRHWRRFRRQPHLMIRPDAACQHYRRPRAKRQRRRGPSHQRMPA
mmetsp:Transcript_6306/g.22439  ORF Transcript_6306/g.22439 Transcript_6306/m.22439 type:complete len:334 (+) Transcript_6306:2669-3670(+)